MHRKSIFYFVLLFSLALALGNYPEDLNFQASSSSCAAVSVESFIGRWDLSIKAPTRELPSWIEVSEEQGQPKVVMVGVSDHATPLAKVEIKEGEIQFVSPKIGRAHV